MGLIGQAVSEKMFEYFGHIHVHAQIVQEVSEVKIYEIVDG